MLCRPFYDPTESLHAQARRTAAYMLKRRARDYARRPMQLEILFPGLAAAAPDILIAVAAYLLEKRTEKSAALVRLRW